MRLFLPLGHIRMAGKYYDADFTELRDEILSQIDYYMPSLRMK